MLTTDSDTSSSIESKSNEYFITFLDGQQHAKFTPSQHKIVIHDGTATKFFELSYTSSRILELLILKADVIVSREEIFSFAWPRRVVGQNSLNQAISNIRELFHDDEHRAIIQTFPRRGYRFNSSYLSTEKEKSCFVDIKEGLPTTFPPPSDSAPVAPPSVYLEALPETSNSLSINHLLGTFVVVLLVALLWRMDWLLAEQSGLSVLEEATEDLTVFYTSESEGELIQIKSNLLPIRQRISNLITQPETVIFNRMHSFYEITCIDRGTTVRFITVHKKQLDQISDAQLKECLE
ncbi:winged helix-turn-helix domain-containing protein [Pseudomonas zeae]|uniref:winged helix-turn-helix domain-containing protein n=1 Tax=Pseudomonas zeae TaxID=2745510 RepID=UPI0039DF5FBF